MAGAASMTDVSYIASCMGVGERIAAIVVHGQKKNTVFCAYRSRAGRLVHVGWLRVVRVDSAVVSRVGVDSAVEY